MTVRVRVVKPTNVEVQGFLVLREPPEKGELEVGEDLTGNYVDVVPGEARRYRLTRHVRGALGVSYQFRLEAPSPYVIHVLRDEMGDDEDGRVAKLGGRIPDLGSAMHTSVIWLEERQAI